jgi:hypothetical protein
LVTTTVAAETAPAAVQAVPLAAKAVAIAAHGSCFIPVRAIPVAGPVDTISNQNVTVASGAITGAGVLFLSLLKTLF